MHHKDTKILPCIPKKTFVPLCLCGAFFFRVPRPGHGPQTMGMMLRISAAPAFRENGGEEHHMPVSAPSKANLPHSAGSISTLA